jgi:hypothetical protein
MNLRRIARAGSLILSSAVVAAAILSAPAHADNEYDNDFLTALANAGIGISDPATATAVGESVCSTLQQSGPDAVHSASDIAQSVGAQPLGISPGAAGLFTSIAVSAYCPQMVSRLAGANLANLQVPQIPADIPGVNAAIPPIPAGIPALPFGIPGF